MTKSIGIDGCKSGWFFLEKDGETFTFGVAKTFSSLCESLPENSRVCIDIPIGLIDHGPAGRVCDVEARKLLGRSKASSVFPAPCRSVLHAQDYEEAKALSFQAIGKKLSKQAFAITPKIREVDEYLRSSNRKISIREVHPEVCFWALNGRSALVTKKKRSNGFEQRLALLEKVFPNARDLVDKALNAYLRKKVARDDVLDALVALVVACAPDDTLKTVPAVRTADSTGLPMEIVFTEWKGHAD